MTVAKTVKRFLEWIGLKEKLHNSVHKPPLFKEGEVWWCSFGENIGIEVNGKGGKFSRPAIIFKKLSADGFFAIPLSTQIKSGTWCADYASQHQMRSSAQSGKGVKRKTFT